MRIGRCVAGWTIESAGCLGGRLPPCRFVAMCSRGCDNMLDVLSHSGGEGTAMDAFVSRRALISSLSLAAMSAGLGACGISGGRSTGLSGSSSLAKSTEQKPLVQQKLESMTLEQKVAQLFLVTPEQFTGVSQAVVAGSVTQRALEDIPVGGLCYFAQTLRGTSSCENFFWAPIAWHHGPEPALPRF